MESLLPCKTFRQSPFSSYRPLPMRRGTATPLWQPYGGNHIVIRKELLCSPCNKAECEDYSCMNLITVEEVMDAVRKQLRIIQ